MFDFVVRNLARHLLIQQQAKLLRSKVRPRPAVPLLYYVHVLAPNHRPLSVLFAGAAAQENGARCLGQSLRSGVWPRKQSVTSGNWHLKFCA
jgi:hypothetical protein